MGQEYVNMDIRNRLYNHEMSIDKEALWNSIAATQSTRVVPYWKYLLGLFILSTVALGAYTVLDNNENSTPPSKSAAIIIATNIEDNLNTTPKDDLSNNEPTVIASRLASPTIESKQDATEEIKTIAPLRNNNQIKKTTNTNSSQPQTSSNNIIPNEVVKESFINNEVTNTNPNIAFSESENNLNLSNSNDIPKSEDTKALRWSDLISSLPSINTTVLATTQPIELDFSKNKQSCYAFGKQRHPWSLYAYAGPSVLMKNLSTNTVESETYRSERESSEDVLESIRAGIQLKYEWESGWYAKAGIETNRLNEKLQFTTMTDSTYTLENQVIRVIINSDGSETEVLGDITVTETKTERATIYNKYKFVNIPLAFGYNKSRNRWSYGAEVGMHFNLNFDFEGQLLSQNGQPIEDPDFFKGNVGLALSFTGGIGYQILPRIKLWLTPSVMRMLRPINIDSYPIDQNYTTTGLLLGAEMKF